MSNYKQYNVVKTDFHDFVLTPIIYKFILIIVKNF